MLSSQEPDFLYVPLRCARHRNKRRKVDGSEHTFYILNTYYPLPCYDEALRRVRDLLRKCPHRETAQRAQDMPVVRIMQPCGRKYACEHCRLVSKKACQRAQFSDGSVSEVCVRCASNSMLCVHCDSKDAAFLQEHRGSRLAPGVEELVDPEEARMLHAARCGERVVVMGSVRPPTAFRQHRSTVLVQAPREEDAQEVSLSPRRLRPRKGAASYAWALQSPSEDEQEGDGEWVLAEEERQSPTRSTSSPQMVDSEQQQQQQQQQQQGEEGEELPECPSVAWQEPSFCMTSVHDGMDSSVLDLNAGLSPCVSIAGGSSCSSSCPSVWSSPRHGDNTLPSLMVDPQWNLMDETPVACVFPGKRLHSARGEDHLMGMHPSEDEHEMDHSTGAPLLKRALLHRFDYHVDEDEEAEGDLTVSPHMHQLHAHMRAAYPWAH